MAFAIGPEHIQIDNFRGGIGSFVYSTFGSTIRIEAKNGRVFDLRFNDAIDPGTGSPFSSLTALTTYLDTHFFS